jgi:N-acetylmuramoyl-L-alanine amidase
MRESILLNGVRAGTVDYEANIEEFITHTYITGDRFALLIGHTMIASGAKNYLGVSEFEFNKSIAYRVAVEMFKENIHILTYLREIEQISVGVRELADHMAKARVRGCISLHFNSFADADGKPRVAMGAEALLIEGHKNSVLALTMLSTIRSETEIWARGIKFVKETDRGFPELHALSGIPSCLVEPCFGNTENVHSKTIFEKSEQYVSALCKGIRRVLKLGGN